MYFLRVSVNDRTDDQILDLRGLELEQAERFAGDLRYEIEQAREVNAPVVQMTVPGAVEATIFEPGRIVGIDLEESTGAEATTGPEATTGAEVTTGPEQTRGPEEPTGPDATAGSPVR